MLDVQERRKLSFVAFAQTALGILDLIGVAIIGLIGSLAVTGIQSKTPNVRIGQFLEFARISSFTFQKQVAILGMLAAVILVGRSVLTMFISRKILYFLSFKSASISSKLVAELLSRNITQIKRRSSQETLFALTSGVEALMLNVAGTAIGVFADTFLLIILCIGLFVFDPFMAMATFLLFSGVAAILYLLTQRKVTRLGEFVSQTSVASNIKILEVVHAFREIFVHNCQAYYSNEIADTRFKLAKTNAELSFVPSISKYVLEITMVLGGILFSALEFVLHDSDKAISTLAIFIASASRIAPAVLRFQSGVVAIKSNMGVAKMTLELVDYLSPIRALPLSKIEFKPANEDFTPELTIHNLSFTHSGNNTLTIKNISLEVSPGQQVAFVGSSGAGKSTLIDLILGLYTPSTGTIDIGGKDSVSAIRTWPGAISYVPQQVHISNNTVLANVAFGFPEPDLDLAWEALEAAQLTDVVRSMPNGIFTSVGENGTLLSGGERQRLGIARALYTRPKLLVLDEATSSLDAKTEVDITRAIKKLRGHTTVLIVAHRLSSVKDADCVVYMSEGEIIASGNFENVKSKVPNFDTQAKLMGL